MDSGETGPTTRIRVPFPGALSQARQQTASKRAGCSVLELHGCASLHAAPAPCGAPRVTRSVGVGAIGAHQPRRSRHQATHERRCMLQWLRSGPHHCVMCGSARGLPRSICSILHCRLPPRPRPPLQCECTNCCAPFQMTVYSRVAVARDLKIANLRPWCPAGRMCAALAPPLMIRGELPP